MLFADEGNTEHRHAARAQGLDREQAMVDRAEFGSCADNRWRAPSCHHIGEEKIFRQRDERAARAFDDQRPINGRSEEHTSELQSLMRISYAVFCLKKKSKKIS